MIIERIRHVSGREHTPTISLRCPACRHQATFDPLGSDFDIEYHSRGEEYTSRAYTGQRRCGNRACQSHLFVVIDYQGGLLASYPPEVIDFDSSDLPERVVDALSEAIRCHAAGCYVAAAIMVRKTLEEVCAERGATGKDLWHRIQDLGGKAMFPEGMLDGLHNLRLLGNDAAHLESRTYEEVGQEEVEVGLDVAKEILKAVYQYKGLMGRLTALQKQPDAEPTDDGEQ